MSRYPEFQERFAEFLERPVAWQRTRSPLFVYTARVDQSWWVLRQNSFPEHDLYTLLVDRVGILVITDTKNMAPGWDLDADRRPALSDEQRTEVLTLMRGLGRYASEVGEPCEGDFCYCDHLTDDYAQEIK